MSPKPSDLPAAADLSRPERETQTAGRGAVAAPAGEEPESLLDWICAAGIAVAFYLIGLWRLGYPNQQIFDEVYHARTGMQYVLGQSPTEWTHPPLTKLLVALSLRAWHVHFDPRDGFWSENATYPVSSSFAWRFPSLLFGAASLVVMYILARTLFGKQKIATAATLLLALDGAFFVQSRVAMTNIFTVFFVLLSTLGTYRFLKTNRLSNLLLTGFGIAFALATRWSTLYVWGLTWIALLWHLFSVLLPAWRARSRGDQDAAPAGMVLPLLQWLGMCALCMVAIPCVIYMLVYIPNLLQGPGDWHKKLFTLDGAGGEQSWKFQLGFINTGLQHNMWTYHAGIKDKHPYSSPWWSWPIMLRPVWYYYQTAPNDCIKGVWCIGNGLVWWFSVPALLTAAYMGWRAQNKAALLVALMGLGQWLMWGVEPRSLVFMHYYFESIPYACLAIAYLGSRIWDSAGIVGRWMVGAYAVLVVGWAIFFYPLLSALPISRDYYTHHLIYGYKWV